METNEHKQVGDQIRIETLDNPYFSGSKDLSTHSENNLRLQIMQKVDDIPVPLDLELSAGDVVALAGDYYTKAGWGTELNIPQKTGDCEEENWQLVNTRVSRKEAQAFRAAYDDLASPKVTKRAIARIYRIEESNLIPSLLQQLLYALTVKEYGKKLANNEAHFAPWSLRAYIVGHNSALRMAEIAFYCLKIGKGEIQLDDIQVPLHVRAKLTQDITKIHQSPQKYKLEKYKDEKELLTELGHRYHALAVARDLFAMHFYSDHFAGGHLSRLGMMRQILPQQFGMWGSILVNNMHNEDNEKKVVVINSFQPPSDKPDNGEIFHMLKEHCDAYGDGTYFNRENNENSNLLINGMDNSLGDIACFMSTGKKRAPDEYGGLTFLPEIDYNKRQTQPLLLQGPDKKIYFRSDVRHIKILTPTEYALTMKNPSSYGYEELTPWKAFLLVVKLRVFAPFYSSQVESITQEREKEILQDEKQHENEIMQLTTKQQLTDKKDKEAQNADEVIGAWRKQPPVVIYVDEQFQIATAAGRQNQKDTIEEPVAPVHCKPCLGG